MIAVVLEEQDVTVTVTAPLIHRCPFVPEVDAGTIDITWRTSWRSTFELHSLRRYLDEFKDVEVSHEALTERIRRELSAHDVEVLSVVTHWQTTGMDVQCSTSPTPVVPR